MNGDRVKQLSEDVVKFVLAKVEGIKVQPVELAYALGEALAILIAYPYLKDLQRRGKLPPRSGEEEEEEEEEEEFDFQSDAEKAFAFQQLSSKFPYEIVCLIGQGKMEVPGWLQKEIIKRRG